MPLNNPTGHYLAKLRWRLDGDPEEMICALGLHEEGPATEDLVQIAHRVHAAWDGAWAHSSLSPSYVFVGADVIRGGTGGADAASYASPVRGTQTPNCIPQNSALLVKKHTAAGGKHMHGRMFLPAGYIPTNTVDPTGQLTGGYDVQCSGYLQQFLDNLADTSPDFLGSTTVSALQPRLFHNGTMDPTPITSLTCESRIATQRQRLRR